MKTVIMLDLGGVQRGVEFISKPMNAGSQLMIELADERPLSQIAEEFEGCGVIRRTDNLRADIVTTYEGFTQLRGIQRNAQTGNVRLTLTKP